MGYVPRPAVAPAGPTKPKKQWQFRLGDLFAVVLSTALLCGWVVWWYDVGQIRWELFAIAFRTASLEGPAVSPANFIEFILIAAAMLARFLLQWGIFFFILGFSFVSIVAFFSPDERPEPEADSSGETASGEP